MPPPPGPGTPGSPGALSVPDAAGSGGDSSEDSDDDEERNQEKHEEVSCHIIQNKKVSLVDMFLNDAISSRITLIYGAVFFNFLLPSGHISIIHNYRRA